MSSFLLNSKRLDLPPSALVGEGGEAEVYKVDEQRVAKVYKLEDHPEFASNPSMQKIAADKNEERQTKLLHFPQNLPPELIIPEAFLYSTGPKHAGKIVGYTMRYVKNAHSILELGQRDFRDKHNIDREQICRIFAQIHKTLSRTHAAQVVVGDFNSLNVIVQKELPYLIDTDSMQFGPYLCNGFTSRYVDPVNCTNVNKSPYLAKPYNAASDWYAFAVMLFECLLFVHPFAGVHKPANLKDRISSEERSLRRISVFHPEVQYPNAAEPLASLPQALLNYFKSIFENDKREEFPLDLLNLITPGLAAVPGLTLSECKKAYAVANGQLACIPIFQTEGKILSVAWQNNKLNYVYWEAGKYFRESATQILSGQNRGEIHFILNGNKTIALNAENAFLLSNGKSPERISSELYRGEYPVVTANSTACFFADGGRIWRQDEHKLKAIEDTLPLQTQLWVNEHFGFAFYQASQFKRAFIFDLHGAGRTLLAPEVVPNNLIRANCYLSQNTIWFFTMRLEQNKFINRCTAIDSKGAILASCEVPMSDDSWLGHFTGKTTATRVASNGQSTDYLISTVNGGIVQIAIESGQFVEQKRFDLTEVSCADNLAYSSNGLFLWNNKRITLLSSDLSKLPAGSGGKQAAVGT